MAVNYKDARMVTLGVAALGAILGLILFIMTITFVTYPNFIEEYISLTKVRVVCFYAIALSVLLILSSVLTLVSALQENVTIMKVAIGLLVVSFVLNVVGIILASVLKFRAQEDVNDQIYNIMRKYNQEEFQRDTDIWDFFQKEMQCCGSGGPGDWKFMPFFQNGDPNQLIPRSCCKAYATMDPLEPMCQQMVDTSLYYNLGCKDAVNKLSWLFCGTVAVILILECICGTIVAILSWVLVKELSKDDTPYEFSAPPSTAPRSMMHPSGTIRSQATGAGSYAGQRQFSHQNSRDQHEAPVSETGSNRQFDMRRNPVGLNGAMSSHRSSPAPEVVTNNRAVSPSTGVDYRPQLPRPPPPPVAAAQQDVQPPVDDDEDFDV